MWKVEKKSRRANPYYCDIGELNSIERLHNNILAAIITGTVCLPNYESSLFARVQSLDGPDRRYSQHKGIIFRVLVRIASCAMRFRYCIHYIRFIIR